MDEPLEVAEAFEVQRDNVPLGVKRGDMVYRFSNGETIRWRMIPDLAFAEVREAAGSALREVESDSDASRRMEHQLAAIRRFHQRTGN